MVFVFIPIPAVSLLAFATKFRRLDMFVNSLAYPADMEERAQYSIHPIMSDFYSTVQIKGFLRDEVQLMIQNGKSDYRIVCPACQQYCGRARPVGGVSDLNQSLDAHATICARRRQAAPVVAHAAARMEVDADFIASAQAAASYNYPRARDEGGRGSSSSWGNTTSAGPPPTKGPPPGIPHFQSRSTNTPKVGPKAPPSYAFAAFAPPPPPVPARDIINTEETDLAYCIRLMSKHRDNLVFLHRLIAQAHLRLAHADPNFVRHLEEIRTAGSVDVVEESIAADLAMISDDIFEDDSAAHAAADSSGPPSSVTGASYDLVPDADTGDFMP